MAEKNSPGMGEQEAAAQPGEQVEPQRNAEEGVAGNAAGRGRPGYGGPSGGGRGQSPAAPHDGRPGGPQAGQPGAPQDRQPGVPDGGKAPEPDVVLQIPRLKVEQIYLEVDNLDAHVSLRARLANLLHLDVGVQARLGTVKLDIKGVETEALLEVRLEELHAILDRALSTIDNNPQILESLVKTVDTTVNQVGQTAQQVLGPHGPLSRTLDQVGQTAQQTLGPQGPLSQTLQQTTERVGQQFGQATEQLGQQLARNRQQPAGRAAAGDSTGSGGTSARSLARAAGQRMKGALNSIRPLRQVTARLVGPPGQGQQHGS